MVPKLAHCCLRWPSLNGYQREGLAEEAARGGVIAGLNLLRVEDITAEPGEARGSLSTVATWTKSSAFWRSSSPLHADEATH